VNPRVHRSRVTHERWLVSYADFITLMFAFFVVLYATASADKKKQAQVSDSIDSAFQALGIFPGSARRPSHASASAGVEKPALPMNIVMGEDVLAPVQVRQDLNRIQDQLTQTLSNQIAGHTVSIRMGRDGLVISLREAGFFDSGSAVPKPGTLPILREVAARLARTPYELRIEGHTDNIPIHTAAFNSNWELSTARATGIAQILLEEKLMPPERLSAAGYAEFHPVASNRTPEGRGENRRVDLVVLPRVAINFAQPAELSADGAWRKVTDE
jgi:chemotaxis protein MotB